MTTIMCVTPSAGGGWAPVTTMAQLMGRCLDAPVHFIHPVRDYGRLRRLLSLVPETGYQGASRPHCGPSRRSPVDGGH